MVRATTLTQAADQQTRADRASCLIQHGRPGLAVVEEEGEVEIDLHQHRHDLLPHLLLSLDQQVLGQFLGLLHVPRRCHHHPRKEEVVVVVVEVEEVVVADLILQDLLHHHHHHHHHLLLLLTILVLGFQDQQHQHRQFRSARPNPGSRMASRRITFGTASSTLPLIWLMVNDC